MATTPRDAHGKALALNLDPTWYGTFAEIGAGQEVARHFLRAGGASGTIAQTICAYDKAFSDATYGAGTRYVSRERLLAMLAHEYDLVADRLGPTLGAATRFFVFADTVSARNFQGTNEQHGWVGVRFQATPGAPPSDVLLHVNLADRSNLLQQQAVGLLGVNLTYAAACQRGSAAEFLGGLFHELSAERVEVDVIELVGPAWDGQDGRAWSIEVLRRGMARALVFDSGGGGVVGGGARLAEPAAVFRKRAVLVEQGEFDPIEPYHLDMLRDAARQLAAEGSAAPGRPPAVTTALTLRPAAAAGAGPVPPAAEVLDRVARLVAFGPVIVSEMAEAYHLSAYLRRYTQDEVRLVLGVSGLVKVFQDHFYTDLPGQLLEGMGKLLASNVKVYAHPMSCRDFAAALRGTSVDRSEIVSTPSGVVTARDLRPRMPVAHLYAYLLDGGWIVPLTSGVDGGGGDGPHAAGTAGQQPRGSTTGVP